MSPLRHPGVAPVRKGSAGRTSSAADGPAARATPVAGPTAQDVQRRCACGGGCPRCTASGGRSIEPGVRSPIETAFGEDFAGIRVHTDRRAAIATRQIGAEAFTDGANVYFGAGRFDAGSPRGRGLLAHEFAHVVQRRRNGEAPSTLGPADDAAEREADAAATAVLRGRMFRHFAARPPRLARQRTGGAAGETDLIDPDALLENPYESEIQAAEFARATISVVKDPILAALRRYDSIEFLRRLRDLDARDRGLLLEDRLFLDAIHAYLRGTAYWIVLLLLRYGPTSRRPAHVRQLYLAVSDRDWRRVRDLLRAFPDLRNPDRVPGVRPMLSEVLAGTRERAGMLALFDEAETGSTEASGTYREVHYEQPEGGGDYALERFTGTTRYTLTRSTSEARAIVRIHLVHKDRPTETWYPDDERANQWRRAIEDNWNNRFVIINGVTRLRVVYVPVFTAEAPHHVVRVDTGADYARSNEHEWWGQANGLSVAHEFGHMLGNVDEYRLPGGIAEIGSAHGLSVQEELRSSVEGIEAIERPRRVGGYTLSGIMGSKVGGALARHVAPLVLEFNAHLLQPGEPRFRLE